MITPDVIAIDGPSASGKSSTASMVASRLGMTHIDTGSLYRALTWLAVDRDLHDPDAIVAAAESEGIHLTLRGGTLVVVAGDDERDLEGAIRSPAVTAHVSAVSALPEVRDWINRRLRVAVRATGGGVLDGRDIGTVVFPDAPLKVFLTATPEARARRRLRQRGDEPAAGELQRETDRLDQRDRLDAARPVAPLRQAPDAVLIDTTELSLEAQVARIVDLARQRGLPRA